jgi:uncharacterized protein YfbU (UPF0304 family)
MTLSKTERVMLINQYEILKRLDEKNAVHYEQLIEILTNGFEIFYSDIDQWVADDIPESEGKLVLDILTIYGLIGVYKAKHPEDVEVANHHWSDFRGFDGNNESDYLAFTGFLINKQGKFAEQLENRRLSSEFNSHYQVLDKYRQMVATWKEMGKKIPESHEDILKILGD